MWWSDIMILFKNDLVCIVCYLIYMELTNEQLAEQLRKLKIDQQYKQAMIDSIVASDP